MSFYATFELDGDPTIHEVMFCRYSFNQAVDDKGRPSSDVRHTRMNVNILSKAEDGELTRWGLDPFLQKSGTIKFYRPDQESVIKELRFSNAYCTMLRDKFDATGTTGESSFIKQLVISYEKLDIQGVQYDARWNA
ncbi:MAG TPA: type VI secretion system tube protein TssD [Hymenobacter sp.]|nr:type VI secretion system tube protein TssD [Hymenobacter sp.]